jgi:hypothetical protein
MFGGRVAVTNPMTVLNTAAPTVTAVTVSAQPHVTYVAGARLDLTGMEVRIDRGTGVNAVTDFVPFARFADYGITTSLANNIVLSTTHHDERIVVTVGSLTATTNRLVVMSTNPVQSLAYDIDRNEGVIFGATGTPVSEFLEKVLPEPGLALQVFDNQGVNITNNANAIVGTGATVVALNGAAVVEEFVVVVKGDVTGCGEATAAGMLAVINHFHGVSLLDGPYLHAASLLNEEPISAFAISEQPVVDRKITMFTVMAIRNLIFG